MGGRIGQRARPGLQLGGPPGEAFGVPAPAEQAVVPGLRPPLGQVRPDAPRPTTDTFIAGLLGRLLRLACGVDLR